MPTNILHQGGMLGIHSHNRVLILYTPIEYFDFPICKASDESLGGSMIRYKSSNWTVGIGVQVLLLMVSINQFFHLRDVPDPGSPFARPTPLQHESLLRPAEYPRIASNPSQHRFLASPELPRLTRGMR